MTLININSKSNKEWTDIQIDISCRQGYRVVDIPFQNEPNILNNNILLWYSKVINDGISTQESVVFLDEGLENNQALLGFFDRLNIKTVIAQYGATGGFIDYKTVKPNEQEQTFAKKLPFYKRSWLIIKYLFAENIGQLLLVAVAGMYTLHRWFDFQNKEPIPILNQATTPTFSPSAFMYWDFFEPIVGFATLGIAVFVWYNEQKGNWLSKLPKRLDVRFVFDGKVVGEVFGASLAHAGDVRQYAQQMGRTALNGNSNLEMELKFDIQFDNQPHCNHLDEIYLPCIATLYLKKSDKNLTNTAGQNINEFLPLAIRLSYPLGLGVRHHVRTNTEELFPLV